MTSIQIIGLNQRAVAPNTTRLRRLPWLRRVVSSRLATDCTGAAAVMLALSLSSVLGIAGLATEVAGWYTTKQTMQGAADAAAFTALTAKGAGASIAQLTTEAQSIASNYKFINGSAGVTVTVNNPPTAGTYQGNSSAVEVIVSQSQKPLVSGLFMSSGPTLQARAVAASVTTGTGCVAALDRGDVIDVTDTGSSILNLNGCSLYINSNDTAALTMSGSAVIDAGAAYITGGVSTSGHAALATTKGTFTGVAPINDPYASVAVPFYSGCNQSSYSLSSSTSQTISATGTTPYVFCNGLSLSGSSSLTLGAGIYVIDRGSFSMSGSSTLMATSGTTIVLTSSTGANYATVSLSGGASVSLTAPSTGATAGLAFFQDRNAPSSGSDSFTGGSTQNITGAVYFPNQTVTYSGGASTGGSACTQLVAYKLHFSGNSTFNNSGCSTAGTETIGSSSNQVVE
jgi:Flp pilus assembly protein TadG